MRKLNNVPVWRITLILMGIVFFTAYMSAGIYAKYASELGGSGTVQIARFDGGSISLSENDEYSTGVVTAAGAHVFSTECTVSFADCEVSREFTLTVSTPATDNEDPNVNNATFKCPVGDLYTLESCGGSTAFSLSDDVGIDTVKIDGEDSAVLVSGKAYVGIKAVGEGDYVWTEATVSEDGKTLTAVSNKFITMYAQAYTVKILYFRELTNTGAAVGDIDLSFNLSCEQVD